MRDDIQPQQFFDLIARQWQAPGPVQQITFNTSRSAVAFAWRPYPEQIASARRGYEEWWQALDWVRDGLMAGRMLREVEVTAVMPKLRPWGAISSQRPH
jgi:hypothetical protein